VKRHISSQLTFILSIIASVFLFSGNSMAGEKQWVGWDQQGIQVSVITIDPVNTSTLYIGTQRGAFRSTDGGSNWISISKGLNKSDVLTLAIDPDNPNTVYAGINNGVFKSTNGGTNWSEINNGLNKRKINALAIDPGNKNILYAGTLDGIYKSTDGGNNWVVSK